VKSAGRTSRALTSYVGHALASPAADAVLHVMANRPTVEPAMSARMSRSRGGDGGENHREAAADRE
jgi:hypothetical protein